MSTRILQIALVVVTFVLMSTLSSAQQDQTITITSDGVQRRFLLHLPSESPAGNLPVLLCYHGLGSRAEEIQYVSDFNVLADQYNFIAVFPQALQIGGDFQWNVYVDDQPGHAGVPDPPAAHDDIQFTRDIIGYLADNYSIDRKRVYASGFSNGGYMCYALSMLASDAIAAIAPVAGNLWTTDDGLYVQQLISSGTAKPMPVMHIHGTADEAVSYPDPDNTPKEYGEWPLWIAARSCDARTYSQVVPIMNNVDKLVFCPGPVEVSLIRIKGMGHDWTNGTYQTSNEIATFFGLDKGVAAAVRQTRIEGFSVMPNPANTVLRITLPTDATVQLINPLGVISSSAEFPAGLASIPCNDLPAGMYSVRIIPAGHSAVIAKQIVVLH